MPSNIRRRVHQQMPIGAFELWHLQTGDCLMGGGCLVCREVRERDPVLGTLRVLRADIAAEVWRQHRAAIIADWTARLDAMQSPGSPCFAEVWFDGARLPSPRAHWPEHARDLHAMIAANLETERAASVLLDDTDDADE